jgi:hypothetical protein
VPLPIKLTAAGRVITKVVNGQTRISCECCEDDRPKGICCMYPAAMLGITYEEDDLPETIAMGPYDLWGDYVETGVKRNGLIYGPAAPPPPPIIPSIQDFHRVTISNKFWERQRQFNNPNFPPWQMLDVQECLFSWDENYEDYPIAGLPPSFGAGTGNIYDEYSDTYVATCTTRVGNTVNVTTTTYHRTNLCVWEALNENGDVTKSLYYRHSATPAEAARLGKGRILWALEGAGLRTPGDGPYNSPEGRYGADGWCVVTKG